MTGGVITLKFEADTSGIDKAIKDIESSASKIDLKAINAITKNIAAQASKANADAKKITAQAEKITAQAKAQNTEYYKQEQANKRRLLLNQKEEAAAKRITAESKKTAEEEKTRRKEIEETERTKRQYSEDQRKESDNNVKLENIQRQAQDDRYKAELTAMHLINTEKQAQYLRDNKDLVVNSQLIDLYGQQAAQKAAEAKSLSAIARSQKIAYDETHQEEAKLKAKTAAVRAAKELNEEEKVQVSNNQTIAQLSRERTSNNNRMTAQIKENTSLINQQTQDVKKETAEIYNATQQEKTKTAEINKSTAEIKLQTAELYKQGREQKQQSHNLSDMFHYMYSVNNALRLTKEGFEDIGNAIKDCVVLQYNFAKAVISTLNPVGTLVSKFVSSSGILNRVKSFFSASGLLNFGKDSITAASDLVEVQNIVETAFPNMVSEAEEWADKSIQAFGLSEKSAKQYAATLGLMAQSAGLAEKSSYKLGTGLTAITADLASMYNMKAEDVYEKIRSGVIGGRTAAIAQLGINMNQANLQAYMASKGMTESYTKLDNATKTAIRYNYALEQTKKIAGDFLKTSKTFANQQRILSEQITAIKAQLGSILVSVVNPILIRCNELLAVISQILDKSKGILSIFGIELQQAASSGGSGVSGLTDDLYDSAEAADAANSALSKLSDGPFSEMHKLSGNDTTGGLTSIFGDSGLLDYDNSKYEMKETETWLDRFLRKFDISGIKGEWLRFLNEIKLWIQAIKDAWNKAWNSKGAQYVQSLIDLCEQVLGLVNDISEAFRTMWESGWGERIFSKALEVATHLNNTVKDIVKNIRDAWNTKSGIRGTVLTDKVEYDDKGFKKNVFEERELTWGEVFAQAFYNAQEALLNFADSFLGFIDEINANMDWTKILEGWSNFLNDFADSLDRLGKWFYDHPEIAAKIGELFTAILSNPEGIIKTVGAITLLKGALSGLPKILLGAFMIKSLGLGELFVSGLQAIFINAPLKLATGIKTFVSTMFADIGAAITGAFEMDGLLGGLLDVGILFAGFIELGGIIISFITKGLPMIFNQIIKDIQGFFGVLFDILIDLINGDILKAITDGLGGIYHWLDDWFGLLLKDIPRVLTGPIDRLVADFITGLIDKIKDLVGWVKDAIDWLGKLINKQGSVKSKSEFNGSSGAAWVQHAQIGNYAKVRFNANGGAYKPNSPQIRVIGDSSQHEYDLTEGHLDNIAERMSGAIINGFMRASAMAGNNGKSGNNTFVIQMGNEQFTDFIVKTVAENAYRT